MTDSSPPSTPASGAEAQPLPASFGLATASFIIIASMVGSGVLTTSGYTVLFVGSNQFMLALWVLGGVTAACGALTLCELTAALPRTGGDYVYLHEAYGPLVAFLSGWVSFLIGFAAPSAANAFGAAKYLTNPLQLEGTTASIVQRGIATILILIFAAIHTSGRKQTAHVQGWITSIKLVLLALFVLAGLAAGRANFGNLADPLPITRDLLLSMMFSLVFISYAYIGWNASSYLAGEFREPQRQLPRAILLSTVGVIVLYLGLNLVYSLALSAADVKAIVDSPSNTLKDRADAVAEIAAIAATRLFGPRLSTWFSVAVGLMLLSSLSAYLLTGPRVIYAMAIQGQFPSFAARLTRNARTPAVATGLQTLCTLALLWTGSFQNLIIYTSVGLSIFSMLAISAIFVLRVKRPDLPRPFRTPGYPVTPAFYLLITGILTAAAFSRSPEVSGYALLSILGGIPLYFLWHWLRGPAPGPGPVA